MSTSKQIVFRVIITAPEIQIDRGTFSSYKNALISACKDEKVKDYLNDNDCTVSIRSIEVDSVPNYTNYKETIFHSFIDLYNTIPYIMST